MAEINLFFIFIGSIGFDLLIGDPKFIVHPVQIIGKYIEIISNFFIKSFGENKKMLFWGGLFISLSTIGIGFSFGKFIELIYFQKENNIIFGILILFGLSSCIASKGLTSSVKEIATLIENREINEQKEKIIKYVQICIEISLHQHLLRSCRESY